MSKIYAKISSLKQTTLKPSNSIHIRVCVWLVENPTVKLHRLSLFWTCSQDLAQIPLQIEVEKKCCHSQCRYHHALTETTIFLQRQKILQIFTNQLLKLCLFELKGPIAGKHYKLDIFIYILGCMWLFFFFMLAMYTCPQVHKHRQP